MTKNQNPQNTLGIKINRFRFLVLVLSLLALIYSGKAMLIYLGFMWLSVEVLNSLAVYTINMQIIFYNYIFALFTTFITINRIRRFKFGIPVEQCLNIVEHLFFSMVVCIKIGLYLQLWYRKINYNSLIITILLFNLLGLVNELFQNWLGKRALLQLTQDSIKDLVINAIGATLFGLAMYKSIPKNANK